jgi:transposase
MISPEQRAEIRRLFFAEHHTVGAIATALGVHRDTVERAIDKESFVTRSAVVRRRGIDAYLPVVRDVFERVPTIRATRLVEILRDRGYKGGVHQVRAALRELRSCRLPAAYLRVVVHPGEQAQCDWGHFGVMAVGAAKRKLSCFVMVLSYSRRLYAVFTFDQTLESFLRGHVAAFRTFGGVPRVILYDNLKAAVLERSGRAVRFNPALLELAGHYHFRPEPCNPARGNEKGRVERAIGYLRTSFFPGRRFKDLADANAQLAAWLEKTANVRPWPQDRQKSVDEAFAEETSRLLPLPEHDADCWHVRVARSDKTAYVRFDLNDYSIPHDLCRKPLTLMASDKEVRLLDGSREVARHLRSFGQGERIEDEAHVEALLQAKKAAMPQRRRETLALQIPEAAALIEMLVERGEPLHGHLRRIYDLIDSYGLAVVATAIKEAVALGTPRSESVGHIIHRRETARRAPPVIPISLPDKDGVRDLVVRQHRLEQYDALAERQDGGETP